MSNKIARLRFGIGSSPTELVVNQKVIAGNQMFGAVGGSQIGGMACDKSGNFYVTDSEKHVVFKVSSSGGVSLLAGSVGVSGDNDDNTNVAAVDARFNTPRGIAVDNSGTVYVCDSGNNQIRVIRDGRVSFLAGQLDSSSGSDDGVGEDASFNTPWGIAVDNSGTLWVSDYGNNSIRKIVGSKVYTFAGGDEGDGEDISADEAEIFAGPRGIAVNARGDIFVCDSRNAKIKKIDPRGWVYLFSGSGVNGTSLGTGSTPQYTCEYLHPWAIACDANTVYVADLGSEDDSDDYFGVSRILRLTANGVPSIVVDFEDTESSEALMAVLIDKNQDIIVGFSGETDLLSSSSSSSSSSSNSSSSSSSSSTS
jgi:sugar lactone lactonase YvrE